MSTTADMKTFYKKKLKKATMTKFITRTHVCVRQEIRTNTKKVLEVFRDIAIQVLALTIWNNLFRPLKPY
jgi:hypothetical protein